MNWIRLARLVRQATVKLTADGYEPTRPIRYIDGDTLADLLEQEADADELERESLANEFSR